MFISWLCAWGREVWLGDIRHWNLSGALWKSAFPASLVIPEYFWAEISNPALQGNDFLPWAVSTGAAEGGGVPVLTLPDHHLCLSPWGDYWWEKDKTHSRQALSDVEKNVLIELLSLSKTCSFRTKTLKLFGVFFFLIFSMIFFAGCGINSFVSLPFTRQVLGAIWDSFY